MLYLFSSCGRPAANDPVANVVAALTAAPGVAPRFSVAVPFRRCIERVAPGGTIPRADCPASRTASAPPLFLRGITPGADDPRSVHLLALFDLAAADPRGIVLERSISSLRRVAELADDPTAALVDLSAALIVRAERNQAPRDLLEAYETAQKAVDRDGRNPAALYNRALALDRFGLVEETAEDWKAAIAADPASDWAGEARRRLRALQEIHAPVPPRDDAPLADYARYAAEEPQGARELGMDKLLPEWGDAVLHGDTARAADRLRRAEALGTTLLRRPGGDASLADMVGAVRSVATDSRATWTLAEAHVHYGRGRGAGAVTRYEISAQHLGAAEKFAGRSNALKLWSSVELGIATIYNGRRDEGLRFLATISVDGKLYPSLAGRNEWARSNTLARAEKWEEALSISRDASAHFARARESPNAATAMAIHATTNFVLGEPDSGYVWTRNALHLLASFPSSLGLHNLLAAMSEEMIRDGLPHAALRLLDEDVAVTRSGSYRAEGLLRRARLRAALGMTRTAVADVQDARLGIQNTKQGFLRQWLEADLKEAEALTLLTDSAPLQIQSLDSAAAYFNRLNLPFRFIPQMVEAADIQLSRGRSGEATTRLNAVFRILAKRRESIRIEARRAAVFNQARGIVERIVVERVAQGDPADALWYLDTARQSLAVSGNAGPRQQHVATGTGEIGLEYAIIGGRLLTWVVTDTSTSLHQSQIDTIRLAQALHRVELKIERRRDNVRDELTWLFDQLIRPVSSKVADSQKTIVVIADGTLDGVPFAALFDSAQQRYFIEKHALVYRTSLRGFPTRNRFLPQAHAAALFVVDPAFDQRRNPLLNRLPGTYNEVRAPKALYSSSILISGEQATKGVFLHEVTRANLIHFAGHAVLDETRPEQSYLVLAGPSGSSGHMTAAELSRLDLHSVTLVVLSACNTSNAGHSQSAGFTGLSGAILAAGAHNVIGSTWPVNDETTTELMTTFHREYATSGDPAQSLQRAQLRLVRSADSRLRSPASWANFRLFGR